jgi:hypothetical protein
MVFLFFLLVCAAVCYSIVSVFFGLVFLYLLVCSLGLGLV